MATSTATLAQESDAGRPSAWQLLKQAFSTFRAHGMTDHAGTLTYFTVMSIFPAILMAVSLLGLFGQVGLATDTANYLADHGADADTAAVIRKSLEAMVKKSGSGAGIAFVIATLLALNGASGAFGAAGRALNLVHGVDEDRSFVKHKLADLGATLLVVLCFVVAIGAIVLGGGIAEDLFGTIGLGSTAAAVWSVARFAVAFAAVLAGFAVVYALAPDITPRRLRWLSPGALFAVTAWIIASIGFSIYIRNFSSYGAAYGAASAIIVLLLWFYITANVFLFGAELNAAIERADTAGRGGPPMVTPPPGAPPPERTTPGGVATAPRAARRPNPKQSSGGPGERSSG